MHRNQPRALPLEYVNPTEALVVEPMPCEKQTAYIRNNAVKSMSDNNVSGVTLRYVQSVMGESNTAWEAMASGALASLMVAGALLMSYFTKDKRKVTKESNLPFAAIFVFSVLNILPNIANTRRYRETKLGCLLWLKTRLSEEAVVKLGKLSATNTKNTLFQARKVLKQIRMETQEIDSKLKRIRN